VICTRLRQTEKAFLVGQNQPSESAESTSCGVNKAITSATETPRNAVVIDLPNDVHLREIYQLGRDTPILRTGAFNPKVGGSIPTRPTYEKDQQSGLA
jgi:hypothetical protein